MEVSGQCSYGIYLRHWPVTVVMVAAFRFIENKTGYPILGSPLILIVYLPATVLTAYVSCRVLEEPARIYLRGLYPPRLARAARQISKRQVSNKQPVSNNTPLGG